MKGLELIRAQIEKSKADRARNSEKAKVSTMKVYPLRNQDQNRLVQVMHRESFSASDIYTTKLHRGILIDWLSGNVQDGRIFLPASGVMAVVTAALWNSRAHFNHLSTTPSFMENAKASWSNVSSIALSDFSFLVDSLEVLDTRAPNVIQSHATCLQTVIGDNGLITVYHKLLDGSVRQIAKGRASAITEEVPLTLQWDAPVAGLEVKMAPYATLHHCYDVPPPLMKIAYQHAISTFFPSTSSVPKLTVYSIIESVRNLWVNHAQLGMLWECGKCQIHAQMKADDRCAVVFAISIAQGSQTSYGSQPPSSLASLVVYGELQISSSAVRQMSLPISGMWVLRSSWENDCEGGSSALVAEAAVEGTSAAAQENKMLLIGAPEHCAAVAHSITAQAPSLLCKVHSEPFPVSLHDTPDDHFAFAATAESKVYKSIVFLLPDSEMLHGTTYSVFMFFSLLFLQELIFLLTFN